MSGSALPGRILSFCIRLGPAVAWPNLRDAFGLTATELSLLMALYLWPFAFMQALAGLLTDTLGPRRSVTIFVMLTGSGQLLLALAQTFAVLLMGRVCTGLGAPGTLCRGGKDHGAVVPAPRVRHTHEVLSSPAGSRAIGGRLVPLTPLNAASVGGPRSARQQLPRFAPQGRPPGPRHRRSITRRRTSSEMTSRPAAHRRSPPNRTPS
jgi:MFS family permease